MDIEQLEQLAFVLDSYRFNPFTLEDNDVDLFQELVDQALKQAQEEES